MSYAIDSTIPLAVEAGIFDPGEAVVWELRKHDSSDVYQTGVMAEVVIGTGSQYSATTGAIADAGTYLGRAYVVGDPEGWVSIGEVSVGVEADALNHARFAAAVPGDGPLDDPAAPPPSGQCRLWTYAYNKLGEQQAGIPHTLTQRSVDGDDYSSSFESQTALSGAALEDDTPAPSVGYTNFLVRNVGDREYRLKREGGGDVVFTVPDGTTSYRMPATLGEDAD